MKEANPKTIREPKLWEALFPVGFLIIALSFNVSVFGDESLAGSNQIVLMLAAAIASLVAIRMGLDWPTIRAGIVEAINTTIPAIIVLLLIGALAGTWLLSGIVPTMVYYGLLILHPKIFLFAACIICAIVSIGSGSSWSTIATLGIALMGIGSTMGISEGLVAGAIISGAYFGDKMSPLSDTTNLAPTVSGTDLYTHIRYMAYTTIPSFAISLLIFLGIGLFSVGTASNAGEVSLILDSLEATFYISPWLFLVPGFVVLMILRKVPPIPTLLAGMLLGAAFAIVFQPQTVAQVAGASEGKWANIFGYQAYVGVMKAIYGSISIETSYSKLNDLLSTGGMYGMLETIWLILSAMMFGGAMDRSGLLQAITGRLVKMAHSNFGLVGTTVFTCVFFNWTASDQYLAVVVPGRMYADAYRKRKLAPENLSRTLEDAGTVTSVLVPWNTCGATQSRVLGVSTWLYMPYCFFNWISPLMTLLFAFLMIRIRQTDGTDAQ